MNQFKMTYIYARAAYDIVIMAVNRDLQDNSDYIKARESFTGQLVSTDKSKLNEVKMQVRDYETSAEVRYRRWEVFDLLNTAEEFLLREYARFMLDREDMLAVAADVFMGRTFQMVLASPIHRQKLINIAMKTREF